MRIRGRLIPVLPALVAWTSACNPVDVALAGGPSWLFPVLTVVALALVAVIVSKLRHWAWYESLENWEYPDSLAASERWWMRWWVPIVSVLVISGAFAWYVFYGNPIPSPPDRQWQNLGAWILGSGIGTAGGFFAGKKLAALQFKKKYPGKPSQGSTKENP